MTRESEIAKVCHEVNRAYCESIGDKSQLPWEACPEWQRESAIVGVKAHLANPDMTPENSHQAWCDHKLKDGWKFGPAKNPQTKEHPCLVEYSELPQEQRSKDFLFRAVVHAMAPTVPCFNCGKPMEDKGAAKQWCSQACHDEDEKKSALTPGVPFDP